MIQLIPSEGAFLREGEPRQRDAIGRFGDLKFHARNIGRVHLGGTQHRVLREDLAVHLGDKEIFSAFVLAPDLPEFDVLDGHKFSLNSDYSPANGESIALKLRWSLRGL